MSVNKKGCRICLHCEMFISAYYCKLHEKRINPAWTCKYITAEHNNHDHYHEIGGRDYYKEEKLELEAQNRELRNTLSRIRWHANTAMSSIKTLYSETCDKEGE